MSTRSRRHRARSSQGEARPFAGMRQITSQAAGVDIGAHEMVARVPDGEDHQIVRTFGTYTADSRRSQMVCGVEEAWNRPACIGCRCLRNEKPAASTAA